MGVRLPDRDSLLCPSAWRTRYESAHQILYYASSGMVYSSLILGMKISKSWGHFLRLQVFWFLPTLEYNWKVISRLISQGLWCQVFCFSGEFRAVWRQCRKSLLTECSLIAQWGLRIIWKLFASVLRADWEVKKAKWEITVDRRFKGKRSILPSLPVTCLLL